MTYLVIPNVAYCELYLLRGVSNNIVNSPDIITLRIKQVSLEGTKPIFPIPSLKASEFVPSGLIRIKEC